MVVPPSSPVVTPCSRPQGPLYGPRSVVASGIWAVGTRPLRVAHDPPNGGDARADGAKIAGRRRRAGAARRPPGDGRVRDGSPMPIRILIVDDHAVVRQGLRMFLALDPELEVVGEAGDGAEAVEQARRLAPDVVLM